MNNSLKTAEDLFDQIEASRPLAIVLATAKSSEEWTSAIERLLELAIRDLESNKTHFHELGEEALSAHIASAMRIPDIISVVLEAHSNGHVDLTIDAVCSPRLFRTLGEAKIEKSYAYHVKGLNQLLRRYSTGREERGFVLAYVKQKEASKRMKKIRTKMDEKRPEEQVRETTDHHIRWSFISEHQHDCGDEVQVCHVGCNLFVEKS